MECQSRVFHARQRGTTAISKASVPRKHIHAAIMRAVFGADDAQQGSKGLRVMRGTLAVDGIWSALSRGFHLKRRRPGICAVLLLLVSASAIQAQVRIPPAKHIYSNLEAALSVVVEQ